MSELKEKKIKDLTVRELRKEIKKATNEVNMRLTDAEYEEGKDQLLDKWVQKLKETSGIKKPRRGIIGTGLGSRSRKNKLLYQYQLARLRAFLERETFTKVGEKKFRDQTERAYQTFNKRYANGQMSREDYDDFVHTFDSIKNAIEGYGYEDIGAELARSYAHGTTEGKVKFINYVIKAKQELKNTEVPTAEDLQDMIVELMKQDGTYI